MRDPPRAESLLSITLFLFLPLLLLLPDYTHAIQVAPDSPCAESCIDSPGVQTNISDPFASDSSSSSLVCEDSQFNGTDRTAAGQRWVRCIKCEAGSDTASPGLPGDIETDVFWFLFNLRYNFAWCVFSWGDGNDNITDAGAACGETCDPIFSPLTANLFRIAAEDRFKYCDDEGGALLDNAPSCIECLEKVDGASIMANYLRVLQVTCDQKPEAGEALDIDFNIFAVTSASTTTTATATTATTTTAVAESTASDTAQASSDDDDDDQDDGDSDKVKIGVGVGVGVGGAISILVLAAWFFIRRRRRGHNGAWEATTASTTATTSTLKEHYSGSVDKEGAEKGRRVVHEVPGSRPKVFESDSRELETHELGNTQSQAQTPTDTQTQ